MTLLVSELKLLISLYPPAGFIFSLFIIALMIACLQVEEVANQDPTFISEFVSDWRIQIFVFGIFFVIIVSFYKIGILMVSKIYKISK